MLLTLCALFVGYVPFTNYHFDTAYQFETTSILNPAYGQTPGPGDPGNAGDTGNISGPGGSGGLGNPSGPDPSAGDNSTIPSNPGDVSPRIGNSTNVIIQNDTSSGPDSEITVPGDLGNTTTTQAVPEFPIAMLVMLIAVASVVVFYRIKPIQI